MLSHSLTRGLWALYAWTDRYQYLLPANFDPYVDPFNTPEWFILMLAKVLSNFCVPAFFFVSGFFVAYAIDKRTGNVPWKTIKNRLLGLIFPFIIWTSIFVAVNAVINSTTQPIDFVLPFIGVGGFWFIPTLFQFYLLARWVVVLAQKNWKILLLCTGLLQVILTVLEYTWFGTIQIPLLRLLIFDNFTSLIVNNMFYFVFGIVLGMNSTTIKNWMDRYRIPLLITSVLLIAASFLVAGWTKAYVFQTVFWYGLLLHLISDFYSIAIILTFLAFDKVKLPFINWFTSIGSKTYGIYLTHIFFIIISTKLVYNYFPALLYYQILFTTLITAISISGSLLMMKIGRKLPVGRAYAYLFG